MTTIKKNKQVIKKPSILEDYGLKESILIFGGEIYTSEADLITENQDDLDYDHDHVFVYKLVKIQKIVSAKTTLIDIE